MSAGDASATGFHALHEIVATARTRLSDGVWGYLVGGAETETTLARNRAALDSLAFRPRVLRDVSAIDTTSTLLGHRVRLPVFVAPVGQLDHFDPGAAATVAEAAASFGVLQMVSSGSPPKVEEVAAAAGPDRLLYQLYVSGDADSVRQRIERIEAAGCVGFCLTVDVAKYSRRERDIANRWGIRWQAGGFAGGEHLAALSWDDVARVRDQCTLPLIVKGIATVEDAVLAVEHGVDVVYVSNHGGRQLDHGLGSMTVLPDIVDAVHGRATVVVDGSINRGTDVVKALALGADAVGIGRLACYGLASAGAPGVVRVLELLEDEIHRALGLLGVTCWDELGRSQVVPCDPAPGLRPGALSAFPLLDRRVTGDG
ncbi:MAG: alpha-hydroxy acid oxidase [Acidimicrobiales bacterium]